MKQQFFFFAVMLFSVASVAQQRTFVKSVDADYATKQVTFNISWTAGSRGTYGGKVYNSKVWVGVDYQEIRNNAPYGTWKRAAIDLTKLPANCTAEGSNTNGFWYQGQAMATQNAAITVTLIGVPAQFKWCAFASDCPPAATATYGLYRLHGTPPFAIKYNGSSTTVTNSTMFNAGCIIEISDATGCPGTLPSPLSAGSITSVSYNNCNNVAGNSITQAMAPGGGGGSYSYQWSVSYNGQTGATIPGATAFTYTPPATTTAGTYVYRRLVSDGLCSTFSAGSVARIVLPDNVTISCAALGVSNLQVKTCDAGSSTWTPSNLCPSGWRWPTASELKCMGWNRTAINGVSTSVYWSSSTGGQDVTCVTYFDWAVAMRFLSWTTNCEGTITTFPDNTTISFQRFQIASVRCVK